MEIINAGLEHIPAIQDIADKTWYETYGKLLSNEQIIYMLDMMYSEKALKEQISILNHNFRIARDESNNFLGFVSFEHNYEGKNKTKLHKLYILPETQGTGLGKLLVEKVLEAARSNNDSSVLLNMNKENKAIGFYKHMGFEIVEEGVFDIGNGYVMDDYIFEIELK